MSVQIIETSDGLELRSTSWIKIVKKMEELTVQRYNDLGGEMPPVVEYEFIEDHIEIFEKKFEGEGATQSVTTVLKEKPEYVITLKKLDSKAKK